MLSRALLSSFDDLRGAITSGPPSLSSTGQRAREYSAEEWEEQRDRFSRLYNSPGISLAQIQRVMKADYGFDATQRQFKRRIKLWGLGRNIRAADGQWMVAKEERRKQEEGKKTHWLINGREVSEARFARIRRKLFKNASGLDPTIRTPPTLRYYTPRSPPGQHADPPRRLSHQAPASHLVECFLCHDVTYGQENIIMTSFRTHVRTRHPGHDILRFLDGFEVAAQVPGTIRTTQQLPSNHCGYVHGVQTQWSDSGGTTLVPVRLGRLCHTDPTSPAKPYLVLTHATSCLTLRAEPKQEIHTESTSLPNPAISQDMLFGSVDESPVSTKLSDMPELVGMSGLAGFAGVPGMPDLAEFGMSSIALGEYQEDLDTYLNEMHIPPAEMDAFLEAWPLNDRGVDFADYTGYTGDAGDADAEEWMNWEADNLFC